MSRVIAEITKDTPVPTFRYIARCQTCGYTNDWPMRGMAESNARLHIKERGCERVVIEDTEDIGVHLSPGA